VTVRNSARSCTALRPGEASVRMSTTALDEWVTAAQRSSTLDASLGETFEKLVAQQLPDDVPGYALVRRSGCMCCCTSHTLLVLVHERGKPALYNRCELTQTRTPQNNPALLRTHRCGRSAELRYKYSIRLWNRVEQHPDGNARVKGERSMQHHASMLTCPCVL
jgi:hypothetical protein